MVEKVSKYFQSIPSLGYYISVNAIAIFSLCYLYFSSFLKEFLDRDTTNLAYGVLILTASLIIAKGILIVKENEFAQKFFDVVWAFMVPLGLLGTLFGVMDIFIALQGVKISPENIQTIIEAISSGMFILGVTTSVSIIGFHWVNFLERFWSNFSGEVKNEEE